MARQPSYRPLEPSDFFRDRQSARPLPPHTVPRGRVQEELITFTRGNGGEMQQAAVVGFGAAGPLAVAAQLAAQQRGLPDYVRAFPFPITREVLERGQQRYTIFCAVCHGPTGHGNGKIVERGYTHPPSFITDESRGMKYRGVRVLLRDVPVGYYFEVISKGFGAMPDYSAQVPPRDRWAIIAYVRALQLSQHARLEDLPEQVRQEAESQLEKPHERGREPSR
jgi:mono/diheme cytochrome c family protein